jgi:hypothetical protein
MSTPEGFRVQLSSLEEFGRTLEAVRADYDLLNKQLPTADLGAVDPTFTTLLGLSNLPGSTAVTDVCRPTLTTYSSLYSKIAQAQTVLKAQLDKIATNTTDTVALYRDVDAKHEAVFKGLLEEFPSGAQNTAGGEDGSAGQG